MEIPITVNEVKQGTKLNLLNLRQESRRMKDVTMTARYAI